MKRKNQNRLGLQTLALISCFVPLTSCKKKAEPVATPEAPQAASIADKELAAQDTPILPVEKGDSWTYQVRLEVPAGLTSPTAKAVDQTSEMKRSALGKIDRKSVV